MRSPAILQPIHRPSALGLPAEDDALRAHCGSVTTEPLQSPTKNLLRSSCTSGGA
jgi:hypothetical protein